MFGDAHAGGRAQIDAAHFAGVGDQGSLVGFHRPVRSRTRFSFDAQQFSGEGWSASGAHLHARASEGGKKIGHAGFFSKREAERSQAAGERCFGVVIDPGDAAAGEVERGQRFEDVVELGAGEIDVDGLAAANVAQMLEIADAVFVEDDATDREVGGGFRAVAADFFCFRFRLRRACCWFGLSLAEIGNEQTHVERVHDFGHWATPK